MAICGNCKAKMGCSCQKRKASDGKSCCTKCISTYEGKLKAKAKKNTGSSITSSDVVILSVTAEQLN